MKKFATPLVLLGFVVAAIAVDQYTASHVGAQELRFANNSRPIPESMPDAIIYVTDPLKTLEGRSSCPPCNQLVRDLLRHYKCEQDGSRVVGLSGDVFFQLVSAPPSVQSVPAVRYHFADGSTYLLTGREASNHATVVRRHPAYNGRQKQAPRPRPQERNTTPFRMANLSSQSADDMTITSTCWVPSSYSYSSNCASSYSSCNGGGSGGGDYYTPPQGSFYSRSYFQPIYSRPQYRPVYVTPRSYYQPRATRWVCTPNGCYRVR